MDKLLTRLNFNAIQKIEFGDALLLIYFVALVRQWFWLIPNTPAWIATLPIAFAFWILFIATKDPVTERPALTFWLIVGLPLLAAYLIRAPIPDSSFDVWGLRLFHGDRGLRGFIYWPGEFFPTAAPFNPTPDMITAIFRHALGYRLGTIVNLLALIWTATILNRLLARSIANRSLRAVAVLLIVFIEHLLFEINNYMPDLLALPVLLEATRLTLEKDQVERRTVVRIALFISIAVALKLSNGAVAMPVVFIWMARCLRVCKPGEILRISLLSILVLIGSLLPFSIWVYKLTGSPIFPLYNSIFRSEFYPLLNGWDDRWGGYGFYEVLTWPIQMFLHAERTAELPVYSGRLSIAFVLAFVCIVFVKRLGKQIGIIAFILITGTLLWSVTMGYIRYGLYLEILSGLLPVMVVAHLTQHGGTPRLSWRTALATLLVAVLVSQSVMGGYYLSRREWSMRPTVFDDFALYRRESTAVFSDRSIRDLLSAEERQKFDRVDVWVVSGAKTSGLMPLLNDQAKLVGVRWGGLFLAPATRAVLERTLDDLHDKEMWSLAFESDYQEALKALRNTGLNADQPEEITIPFFSRTFPVKLLFFRVKRESNETSK